MNKKLLLAVCCVVGLAGCATAQERCVDDFKGLIAIETENAVKQGFMTQEAADAFLESSTAAEEYCQGKVE